jgi:hypothetical protein
LFAARAHIVLSRSLPLCLEPSRSIMANCQQIERAVMLFQTVFEKLKQFYVFFRIPYHRVQEVSLPCEISVQFTLFIPGFLEAFVRLR